MPDERLCHGRTTLITDMLKLAIQTFPSLQCLEKCMVTRKPGFDSCPTSVMPSGCSPASSHCHLAKAHVQVSLAYSQLSRLQVSTDTSSELLDRNNQGSHPSQKQQEPGSWSQAARAACQLDALMCPQRLKLACLPLPPAVCLG